MNKKAIATDIFMAVLYSALILVVIVITIFFVVSFRSEIQDRVLEDSISLDVMYDTRNMLKQKLPNGKSFQEHLVNSYNNQDLENFYEEVELFTEQILPDNKILFIYIQGIDNRVAQRVLFSYRAIQAPVLYVPNPSGNAIRIQIRMVDEQKRGDYLKILATTSRTSPINANLRSI